MKTIEINVSKEEITEILPIMQMQVMLVLSGSASLEKLEAINQSPELAASNALSKKVATRMENFMAAITDMEEAMEKIGEIQWEMTITHNIKFPELGLAEKLAAAAVFQNKIIIACDAEEDDLTAMAILNEGVSEIGDLGDDDSEWLDFCMKIVEASSDIIDEAIVKSEEDFPVLSGQFAEMVEFVRDNHDEIEEGIKNI